MAQHNWLAYNGDLDDAPASILVSLDALEREPDPARTELLRLMLPQRNHTEAGGPDESGFEPLSETDEALCEAVEKAVDAVHVGVMTHQGRRTLAFYVAADDDMDSRLDPVFERFAEFELEASIQPDPQWDFLHEILAPSEQDQRQASDSELVDALRQQGDKLESPRDVDHFAYFESAPQRDGYAAAAVAAGFRVTESTEDPDYDLPFGCRLVRRSAVTVEAIVPLTSELVKLAQQWEGVYDGWETIVVQ